MIESSFLICPSIRIIFAVGPRPTSSLTSNIIPRLDFSSWLNFSFRYCCVNPTNTANNSGIPTPVFALTGTIAISFL